MKSPFRHYELSGPGWIGSVVLGLALISSALFTTTGQAHAGVISLTTFEFDPPGRPVYAYPFNYAWPTNSSGSAETVDAAYADPTLAPSLGPTALRFTFDDRSFEQLMTNTPGAGFGVGFGGGLHWNYDATRFVSSNRYDYFYSFDARVEGLLPGVTNANGLMQLRFVAPDNTLQPSDGDFAPDPLLQIDFNFAIGSNWTHYVFALDQGSLSGGSEASFARYRAAINHLHFDCSFHLPGESFGYDPNNAMILDNLALQVGCSGVPSPPTIDLPIADWNFDTKPAWSNLAYTFAGPGNWPGFQAQAQFAAGGTGGSHGWLLQFDTRTFATGAAGVPGWAVAGTGCNGPITTSRFDTTNLSAYQLTFQAKTEGLAPGQTTSPAEVHLALRAPDDTILPADSDSDADLLLQKTFTVSLKTNWQTFIFRLDQGQVRSGSTALFAQYFSKICRVEPFFEVTGAAGDYGTDNDNVALLDDFLLARPVFGTPPLALHRNNGNAILSWSGLAKLQSAPQAQGPYGDIAGAASPYTVPATNTARFFRTQWAPPLPCDP